MGKRNAHSRPRAVGGGRSEKYARRRDARGSQTQYAAEWSDAAAAAVLEHLKAGCKDGESLLEHSADVLRDSQVARTFWTSLRKDVSPHDYALAEEVMSAHSVRVQQEGLSAAEVKAKTKSFLKPLRERASARTATEPLKVTPGEEGPETFHGWLSEEPKKDRMRDIKRSKRTLKGIAKWPLGWMRREGVVCYERAAGRVAQERKGKPDAEFMKGVVKTTELPTATASGPDHYVVIAPGGEARFMTVQEVGRSFGVPAESPLAAMLHDKKGPLTVNQAVGCLGRSVHAGVARRLVATLMERGTLARGLTYGSAYSGVDTFAAAVEAEMEGDWTYEFASEASRTVRKALLAAWGERGLTESNCYSDARGDDAATARYVDLMVITPNCEAYSKRNHKRTPEDQRHSLEDVWRSLEYVRRAQPRVVIMENSPDVRAEGPLTGLLARLEGYEMEVGLLDPREVARAPAARERRFWVLTRREAHATNASGAPGDGASQE